MFCFVNDSRVGLAAVGLRNGDRSTGGSKPATLETGAQIQVPLFITTGEKVKVDTRSGEYLGRG